MNKKMSINDVNYIVKPLADKYKISEVYLFGSYARGDATDESDLDFLVYGGDGFRLTMVFAFAEELRKALNKEVDVFEIHEVSVDKSADYQNKIQASFAEKISSIKENDQKSSKAFSSGAVVKVEISALGAEELEKVRQSWDNHPVSALYRNDIPINASADGVYRIGKVDFSNLIEQDFYGTEGMTKLLDFAKQWVGTI